MCSPNGPCAASHVADEILVGTASGGELDARRMPAEGVGKRKAKVLLGERVRLLQRVEALAVGRDQGARQAVAHVAPGQRDRKRAARSPEAHPHGRATRRRKRPPPGARPR